VNPFSTHTNVGAALFPLATAVALAMCLSIGIAVPLAWIALVPLVLASRSSTHAPLQYTTAVLGGAIVSWMPLDWIRTSYDGRGLSGENALLWLGMGIGLSPVLPAALWLLRRRSVRRFPYVVALPLVWTSIEFVRFEYPRIVAQTPFPWLQLGATQLELPMAQIADLGGVWLVTLIVAVINGAIADACLIPRGTKRRRITPLAIAAGVLAASYAYGRWRIDQPLSGLGPRIALMTPRDSNQLLIPSIAKNLPNADLYLWSETVLDQALLVDNEPHAIESEFASLDECLQFHATARRTPLLIGCPRVDRTNGDRFNSLVWVAPDDKQPRIAWYDKQALVPWSEFSPHQVRLFRNESSSRYQRGRRCSLFELQTSKQHRKTMIAPLICFDICFPAIPAQYFALHRTRHPDLYVAASCEVADQTGALARAMLTMTRWRAIEMRRPIIRNAEGGWSGSVNSRGEVTVARDAKDWPLVLPPVLLDRRTTLYATTGDWVPIACLTLLATMELIACIDYARSRSSNRISATNSATVL
jgi:apolipoprotein N-acyltransferase